MSGMSKDGLPNTFKVELVEGCNRMCAFCGIQTMWKNKSDRKIKYMTVEMASSIASSIQDWSGCHKKRIEFALHGEPSLHPDHVKIMQIFRAALPDSQILFTTNGLQFIKLGSGHVKDLFDAGVNFMLVDTYSDRGRILPVLTNSGIPVTSFYDKESPFPYKYHGSKIQYIIDMDDLSLTTGKMVTKKLENHGGNSDPTALMRYGILPLTAPLQKKCARPFREMAINYNGVVTICCVDWCHECVMGVLSKYTSLREIWNSPYYQSSRVLLKNKMRVFFPCKRCDYNGGFRLGLLPPLPRLSIEDSIRLLLDGSLHYKEYKNRNALSAAPEKGIRSYL